MIFIENEYQIKWEKLLRQKFGTFPINLNNTGMLSTDETIGFLREVMSGTDVSADSRITKLEQSLGLPPSSGGAWVREGDFPAFLMLKYEVINIAPENQLSYWKTPEGSVVFSKIATELGDKIIPDLDYN
jgi:hypothetical protein